MDVATAAAFLSAASRRAVFFTAVASLAPIGLAGAAVRITAIAEDDNGELTVTAEEIPGVTP